MQAEVIVFSHNSQTKSDSLELNPFHCALVKTCEEKNSAALCLIEKTWLPELRRNTTDFKYRGEKHPKKPLTYYYKSGDKKILFVNGCNFTDYSQLKRSINTLLKNASFHKLNSLFFLVVSEEFFMKAKEETSLTFSNNEASKGNGLNPLLVMINPVDTKINLKERYIGNSEPCMLVRKMIATASANDFPVLILGETGTGKEVVARNIHECSDRDTKPFISINCGAIPAELFESELFGCKKGSHSAAYIDKLGLWELANNGTLFLDEIGDLSLNHQVKILKAIDDGEIMPVGGTKKVKVNARIIAATNKNIEALASQKNEKFRDDLFYRISTFIIHAPSLRSHPEDIPELAAKMWDRKYNNKLSTGVLDQLQYMNWPGNVRQLKHFLEQLHALFGKDPISVEHLRVLQLQELDNLLGSPHDPLSGRKSIGPKEYEKAIMKIEYLLKASLYCEEEDKRRELLENVKESLGELI